MRRWTRMLLSILLSFLLARKFTGKIYVLLTTVFLALISLFSMGLPSHFPYRYSPTVWVYDPKSLLYELKSPLPLSFPFYASIQYSPIRVFPPRIYYLLHFLTFEFVRGYVPFTLGELYLYYSFFLLVNLVGAIFGYWISKTAFIQKLLETPKIEGREQ